MRFAFTDEQLAFRDTLRELLERECPAAEVRRAWSSPHGRTAGAWARLGEMGVLGALAPEDAGGLGLGLVDVVLLLEEAGYAALPEPLVEHAVAAMPMLPDPAPAVAGDTTVTVQCRHDPVAVYVDSADSVLLRSDGCFHLVPVAGTHWHAEPSVDGSRRLARVAWDGSGARTLGTAADASEAFDRGALGTAAQLVGLARRMLDMTVGHVTERHQFGVPVGSFQAVKHHLADARIAIEFARPLVYRAAWSLDVGDPGGSVHVSLAKAAAGDAAHLSGRKALQCHGAIGYSYEHDLHLFLKRAWALAGTWGDAAWHRARAARAIL